MRYYKYVVDGYIIMVGIGAGFAEVSKSEYDTILQIINAKPHAEEGYDYRLREDLAWELYELPPEPNEDATSEDYEFALNRLGVET